MSGFFWTNKLLVFSVPGSVQISVLLFYKDIHVLKREKDSNVFMTSHYLKNQAILESDSY